MDQIKTSSARIERDQALELLTRAPLGELMRLAFEVRQEHHPDNLVTFVYDTNPNYTNVCVTRCRFCAFHHTADDAQAYTLSPAELAEQVRKAYEGGATTVLLQGGHNPEVRLTDWCDYIKGIQAACPGIHIHPFSPSEVAFLAELEQLTTVDVLTTLKGLGIDTMPGGGAEILTERVRNLLSPAKIPSSRWLEIMGEAHSLGFRTTATMMFGHLETEAEIIEHLFRLRELQDRTQGFASFIPWSFKPGSSPLSSEVKQASHSARYVRILAIARLVLDNFEHIQSSWFSENVTAGQLGLLAGADDFGGILIEENVLRKTGFAPRTTLEKVLEIIRSAGFIPARRDSYYRIIERY